MRTNACIIATLSAVSIATAAASSSDRDRFDRIYTRPGITTLAKSVLRAKNKTIVDNIPKWLSEYGVTDVEITIANAPYLLWLKNKKQSDAVVSFFTDRGVTKAEVAGLIEDFGYILSFDVELSLKPVWEWLAAQGVANPGQVIMKFPKIMGYSGEYNLGSRNEVLDWGDEWADKAKIPWAEREQSDKAWKKWTAMVLRSYDDRVRALRVHGISDVVKIIEAVPQVLYPPTQWWHLSRTLDFLINQIGVSPAAIERNPQLLLRVRQNQAGLFYDYAAGPPRSDHIAPDERCSVHLLSPGSWRWRTIQ